MQKLNLELIKRERKKNKITLQEMAELLGFKDASTYYKYENGEYSFKADHLPIIASKLNRQLQDLFFDNRFAETANKSTA